MAVPDERRYELSQRAVRRLLASRENLLRESKGAISRAADEISREYNLQANKPGYEGLTYESVNRIFKDLLSSLPPAARALWPSLYDASEPERLQLFKVFSWSFNRMKDRSACEEGVEFRIKARGAIGGEEMPYPAHTHLDVPFCMRMLGLPLDELSLALAACHDTFEEGIGIQVMLDKLDVRRVDLNELVSRFSEGHLGTSLAVGIAALTESRYVDIVLALPEESILSFEAQARLHRGDITVFRGWDRVLTKIHLQDPLVFGGLALQVCETVRSLVAMAGTAPLALARSILEVELGDRVSDMATLERQLDYYSADPSFARYRTIAYASRLLNMQEKVTAAAALLSGPSLDAPLSAYREVLRAKLEEISDRLSVLGERRIDERSLREFHEEVFRPIQERADEALHPHIETKVSGFLQPLIAPSRPRVDKLPNTI